MSDKNTEKRRERRWNKSKEENKHKELQRRLAHKDIVTWRQPVRSKQTKASASVAGRKEEHDKKHLNEDSGESACNEEEIDEGDKFERDLIYLIEGEDPEGSVFVTPGTPLATEICAVKVGREGRTSSRARSRSKQTAKTGITFSDIVEGMEDISFSSSLEEDEAGEEVEEVEPGVDWYVLQVDEEDSEGSSKVEGNGSLAASDMDLEKRKNCDEFSGPEGKKESRRSRKKVPKAQRNDGRGYQDGSEKKVKRQSKESGRRKADSPVLASPVSMEKELQKGLNSAFALHGKSPSASSNSVMQMQTEEIDISSENLNSKKSKKEKKRRKKKLQKQEKVLSEMGDECSTEPSLSDKASHTIGLHVGGDNMKKIQNDKDESVVSANVADLSGHQSTSDMKEVSRSNPYIKNSSTSAFKKKSLPAIQPIKTIIGLEDEQLMIIDDSDVKLKIIAGTTSLSKYCKNAITFARNHKDSFFHEKSSRSLFMRICIEVALYESIGFQKLSKKYPEFCSMMACCEELKLEHTKTKFTKSSKKIHMNDLDYKVLAYFGHIFIWAIYKHMESGFIQDLFDVCDLKIDPQDVKNVVGGYHLWDRLHREEKHMNSKRWKHIVNLRQLFPYEYDQFLLIMRYACPRILS